jgi:hypothetical protein
MLISCIVLTRNNRDDFRETLTSVLSQRPSALIAAGASNWPWASEIVCIDSSDIPLAEAEVTAPLQLLPPEAAKSFSVQLQHQFPPQGVYPAMNLAVSLARGERLIFMNAGDAFYDDTSLDRLVSAAETCRLEQGVKSRLVFGQAWIVPERGRGPRWLVPDPAVRRISRWLRFFVPNHQTVLVERDWAIAHPFRLDAPHSADRAWLRQALAPPATYVYLPEPVAVFRLGGLSSGLPDWWTLRLRLQEPSRTGWEKVAEVVKHLLRPAAPWYPQLMRIKSAAVGLLCR